MSKSIKLENISRDGKNFNKHTTEGMDLLGKSIEKVGIIESVTVSSDDVVISGNARHEKISEKFSDKDAIIVETDGTHPVILKRTDISSGTKKFHEAALLANTVSTKNMNLDTELIHEILVDEYKVDIEELGIAGMENFDLSEFFTKQSDGRKKTSVYCPHCGKDINEKSENKNAV
jgi:hypothetical protein